MFDNVQGQKKSRKAGFEYKSFGLCYLKWGAAIIYHANLATGTSRKTAKLFL
jgi:hypothetical protein